mmetsp:Transcript_9218/g.29220  ORF Transcript_9218/g.29220 Transcript_9218/m.29220 type:complete len:313 (+) Transcript_9218:162-1100(+)
MSVYVFTARSRFAESLYVGCHAQYTRPRLSRVKPETVPLVIVAGVQKGGSSSMRNLLSQQGMCPPRPVSFSSSTTSALPAGPLRKRSARPICQSGGAAGGRRARPVRRVSFEAWALTSPRPRTCSRGFLCVFVRRCRLGRRSCCCSATRSRAPSAATTNALASASSGHHGCAPQPTVRTESSTTSAYPWHWRWMSPSAARPGGRATPSETPPSARPTRSVARRSRRGTGSSRRTHGPCARPRPAAATAHVWDLTAGWPSRSAARLASGATRMSLPGCTLGTCGFGTATTAPPTSCSRARKPSSPTSPPSCTS